MESVDFMDRHLDPPSPPKWCACDECHDMYPLDDLNDYRYQLVCDSCKKKLEAQEQE